MTEKEKLNKISKDEAMSRLRRDINHQMKHDADKGLSARQTELFEGHQMVELDRQQKKILDLTNKTAKKTNQSQYK